MCTFSRYVMFIFVCAFYFSLVRLCSVMLSQECVMLQTAAVGAVFANGKIRNPSLRALGSARLPDTTWRRDGMSVEYVSISRRRAPLRRPYAKGKLIFSKYRYFWTLELIIYHADSLWVAGLPFYDNNRNRYLYVLSAKVDLSLEEISSSQPMVIRLSYRGVDSATNNKVKKN